MSRRPARAAPLPGAASSIGHRLLIVDDHAHFRALARALLRGEGFDVVGEAADAETAILETRRLTPDVVLLDIQLPGEDGFAVCERLREEDPAPVVILTSGREIAGFRRRLARTSARGFVAKIDLTGAALRAVLGAE